MLQRHPMSSPDSPQREWWQMQRGGRAHLQPAGGRVHGAPASPLIVKVSSLSSNDGQGFLMGTEREREKQQAQLGNISEVLKW